MLPLTEMVASIGAILNSMTDTFVDCQILIPTRMMMTKISIIKKIFTHFLRKKSLKGERFPLSYCICFIIFWSWGFVNLIYGGNYCIDFAGAVLYNKKR